MQDGDVDAFQIAEDYGFDDDTMDRLADCVDPQDFEVC